MFGTLFSLATTLLRTRSCVSLLFFAKAQGLIPCLVSASQVDNERLTSHFVGLIGLAQEDNSILVSQFADSLQFPVSTFSTKLFSLPAPPASRTIGISLERPGQPKSGTPSLLSIGRHPSSVVSDPSKIVYTPITDNGHWRLPVTEIAAWSVGSYDSTAGTYGPGQRTELTLGSTAASGVYSIWPLAIVDTGGAHIISTRSLANMFWGAYGIGPASDGMCKSKFHVFNFVLFRDWSWPVGPGSATFADVCIHRLCSMQNSHQCYS